MFVGHAKISPSDNWPGRALISDYTCDVSGERTVETSSTAKRVNRSGRGGDGIADPTRGGAVTSFLTSRV